MPPAAATWRTSAKSVCSKGPPTMVKGTPRDDRSPGCAQAGGAVPLLRSSVIRWAYRGSSTLGQFASRRFAPRRGGP